jgi:LuxR family transcriptional regulator, maltose regulon positive regulatory protein
MSELKQELLITKTRLPRLLLNRVARPRLSGKLVEAVKHKLVLLSAPAGYGKTTLVVEVLRDYKKPIGWFSLEVSDNVPSNFWNYLITALQNVIPGVWQPALNSLQSPDPPPSEWLLTTIINSISSYDSDFVLVLDDYHNIESPAIHEAVSFLIEHLSSQVHLIIASRIDPPLPLARWRVKGELTEIRAADLRFTPTEAAEFLNQVMGLNLSAEGIAALENRTEGWIAGLQLAAIALQGDKDTTSFIKSFTGSHYFVLDYLLEEVLKKQSKSVQTFLLYTSILSRLSGSLCDAILLDTSISGQETLEHLEHSNLFIVPLDNERRWYRYHHLFADLLRQRLLQSTALPAGNEEGRGIALLHKRASAWYEENGLDIEAFQHAAAANDIERAERLIDEKRLFQNFSRRSVMLNWLASLPTTVLDARPSLWVRYASTILGEGQTTGVEEKLQAAEAALQGAEFDDKTRDLIGKIAATRATLALTRYQPEAMIIQGCRALEYLRPDNLTFRFIANWNIAFAYRLQGERDAACRAFTEALSIAQSSGNIRNIFLVTICLGDLQELDNQLYPAAENFRRALQLYGDQPPPSASAAHLGLARIFYEWNDLDTAEQEGQKSLQLTRLFDKTIDRYVICEVFLARLKLARGDVAGALSMLSQTEQSARQKNFKLRLLEIAVIQVHVLLKQSNLPAAAELSRRFELPLSKARVLLAQGDYSAAMTVLKSFRQQMEARGWADERLRAMVLQAVAFHLKGEKKPAVQVLSEALALAEPSGFIRIFVDEGAPMAQLLSEASAQRIMPDYVGKLLAAFKAEDQKSEDKSSLPTAKPNSESLSQRELEVLQLLAQGLSNREISERLFLALDTVKGHNRLIFDKLHVQRRTEAVARARELGLL